MTLSLPPEKLGRIHESLIGLLHHAAWVVRLGRSFLHHLISLLRGRHIDAKYIRLNAEARADIWWWLVFAKLWNRVSICPAVGSPQAFLTSDASGSWGCGAFSGNEWFQFQWTSEYGFDEHITFKELFPIVLAIMVWGQEWAGLHL